MKLTAYLALLCVMAPSLVAAKTYDARYTVEVRPPEGIMAVELELTGNTLPSQIRLGIDSKRHRAFRTSEPLEVSANEVIWKPRGKSSRLSYEFVVNHERDRNRYDSLMNKDWALFRGDKLVPRLRVTAKEGLAANTTMTFKLPEGWSLATRYAPHGTLTFPIEEPGRKLDRPTGWMIAGKIGVRAEKIAHVQATIAAPVGESARRQDMLAFLNWNLPKLLEVFDNFPSRLLIVSAGDPMWRGGLSGPGSLYVHSLRPLISENRTSTLLHELVHVATRLHSDEESDWIVEGLAEYYSIETLRRTGGISERRYQQALADMERWSKDVGTLFTKRSSGPTTLRAVLVFVAADREIRALTNDRKSLDDVARALAADGGEISLKRLQDTAAAVAGKPLKAFERKRLEQRPGSNRE
jgi:Predicted protease with the C-terminal PDZ domain